MKLQSGSTRASQPSAPVQEGRADAMQRGSNRAGKVEKDACRSGGYPRTDVCMLNESPQHASLSQSLS